VRSVEKINGGFSFPQILIFVYKKTGSNRVSLTAAIPSNATPMTYRTTIGVWAADWSANIQFAQDGLEVTVN
jgi:hypothetical protein